MCGSRLPSAESLQQRIGDVVGVPHASLGEVGVEPATHEAVAVVARLRMCDDKDVLQRWVPPKSRVTSRDAVEGRPALGSTIHTSSTTHS